MPLYSIRLPFLSRSLFLTDDSLEALERSMGKSSSAGAKRPQAVTAADHRDRREKKKKRQHAAAAAAAVKPAAATTTSPSSTSLAAAADALYYPLPQTGTVQEVLAACTKRNSSSVFVSKTGNYSLLETALEQLSSTTRRGAAGSEARGAALARVSEKALLLEDPTAGLASGGHEKNREAALENRGKRRKKKKAKKSACGHSRPKASQLALAAAAAPRPKRAALANLRSVRALAATPAEAVAALEAQWKAYVRKLAATAAAPSSSAFAPSALSALTLVGARARVAASGREAALVGRSGVLVAESRRAWHLFDERGGKVSVVSKAGAELEVEFFARGGGGEGEEGEGEALRSVVAIRVGGGALL